MACRGRVCRLSAQIREVEAEFGKPLTLKAEQFITGLFKNLKSLILFVPVAVVSMAAIAGELQLQDDSKGDIGSLLL